MDRPAAFPKLNQHGWFAHERATVLTNTSVLYFTQQSDPKPVVKNSWSPSLSPTQPRQFFVASKTIGIPCCAKNTQRGQTGMCVLCHRGGGWCTQSRITAGLTRKPHYYKLPHFTLSVGARKDQFDFWENFSHGSIKQSTSTYHTLYSLHVLWNLTVNSWLFRHSLLLLQFFCKGQFCCGVPPDLLLSADACMMLTAVSTEERWRSITTQGTFPQEAPPSLLFSSAYIVGLIFQS